MVCLIPTSQVLHLVNNIFKRSKNFEVVFPNLSRDGKRCFPDGEVYVKIPNLNELRNKRVTVLHSGAPKPNEGLVELELILQILRDYNLKPEVFFSYFPYGMQDEVFEKGETNVAENLIEKLVNYYKVKKIYIIDTHFGGRKWVKKYPIVNISAIPILTQRAKEDFSENILFLSPDIGGNRRTGILGLKKARMDSYRVKMIAPNINLKGRIVGVVDDMIKTGATLLKFQEIAKKAGAKKIIALVTHGVLPTGISKIKKKYSKLYLTNTIKHRARQSQARWKMRRSLSDQKESNIDITDLILKTILKYD